MARFRKKPVVIEAYNWKGGGTDNLPPAWLLDARRVGPPAPGFVIRLRDELHIGTLEGVMTARLGDWIIRGVKGEIYPCKPDIFEETYEPAE